MRFTIILFTLMLLPRPGHSQIPLLDSDPSITNKVVYLDFDGETVSGTPWDSGNTINALPSTMSAANITTIFKRVCEDYSPFDVCITTDVNKFNAASPTTRMRVVITPTSAWYGTAGGVAYVNSFTWGGTPGTPCWVFENQLSYSAKNIAEAISHEVGHTVSLRHQSTYSYTPSTCTKTAEYNPGQGTGVTSWAPIMGVGYYKNVTVWYNGTSAQNCNLIQYDHSNASTGITGPGRLNFRTDDVGNTAATAEILNLNNLNLADSGLITEPSDVDVYKFTICNTRYVTVDVKPWALDTNLNSYQGANLDLRLFLYNSSNNLLAVDSPLTKLNARIGMTLNAGTYHFLIDGGGSGNYSDYGSIGRYYLKVKATNPPQMTNTIVLPQTALCSGQPVQLNYASNGTPAQWLWNVNGASTSLSFTTASPMVNLGSGSYTVSLLATGSNSASCTVSRTLNILPSPVPTISGIDPICAGSSLTLTGSGASTYSWEPGSLIGSSVIVTPAVSTTYSLSAGNGTCNGSTTATVNVSPHFTVAIATSSTEICAGESVTLSASGAGSYTYFPGNVQGPTLVASPVTNITYTVVGETNGNACIENDTLTISLKECNDVGLTTQSGTSRSLKVFPNPANAQVTIETAEQNGMVELVDALGRTVFSQRITNEPLVISTAGLSAGVYLVVQRSSLHIYTQKLIVAN